MSAPNISLLNATYSSVAGVTLPKSGGGTATFPWVEGSQTITQNGTVDVTNLASVTVNVSGGGASNIVTGTFTGSTTGAAMSVSLNYSGNGYPILAVIRPTEGAYNSTTGSWYSKVQRYAIAMWSGSKARMTATPTYATSGGQNYMCCCGIYKSSTSSSTSYSRSSSMTVNGYTSSSATQSSTACVRFNSATSMSVFIAASSYGFASGIEYTYTIIYSE